MNWINGVRGHGQSKEWYIDGKCIDCGKILSKDQQCFIHVADKETLKRALKENFYCFDCGLEHYKEETCEDCGEQCTEDETEMCYESFLYEAGGYACVCPL